MSSPWTTVIAFMTLAILIAAGSALLLLSRPEPINYQHHSPAADGDA